MELLKQCKASSGLPCSTLRLASTCTTNRLCSAFTCDILGETGTPYVHTFKLQRQCLLYDMQNNLSHRWRALLWDLS